MSSTKVANMLKKITEDLKKLKVATTEAEKAKKAAEKKAAAKVKAAAKAPKAKESKAKKAKADRPKSINACTKKAELMLFTVEELKTWLVAKKVEKLSGLKKEDLISKVLKKLKEKAADSDSDSGSESEYTDCDTDSDSSDSSDSDSD